jgi:predicted transcriptional regulator
MRKIRARGEDVRKFIIDHAAKHPIDIAKLTARHFDMTRQSVNKHLQRLTEENALKSMIASLYHLAISCRV